MAAIKQLAGQTLWYGLSNVGARLLNYALTPILTYLMTTKVDQVQYGNMSLIYAWIGFANIIFTYGFETAYFRFTNKENVKQSTIFETAFGSMLISTVTFSLLLLIFRRQLAHYFGLENHLNYIIWVVMLIALDTLSAIPFARLRQESKPRKYAFIKVLGIVINLLTVVFFMIYFPRWAHSHGNNWLALWFIKQDKLGIIIFANLLQNLFVFLALYKEWSAFRFKIDKNVWRQMINYSAPMIIVGLAGMVNEVLDRQMLEWRLPFSNIDNKILIGIYSANYKIAIFISLFIQAFKLAAEPFFFNQAKEKSAPVTYARVMKWFALILFIAFLFITLFLDWLKYFVSAGYRSGLGVVPILILANVFLGIYYNLSVWYKLTDRMRMGMYITLFGAAITLVGNYFFIPKYGMYAGAWSTCICYFSMMVVTYFAGQKYFPVPYPVKKLSSYFIVALILFFLQQIITYYTGSLSTHTQLIVRTITASMLMGTFLLLIFRVENKELSGMPLIGKFIR